MNAQAFGKYALVKKLATGGMAEVWLARQTGIEGFQRDLVIKRILPHLAEDPEFVQMFLNEAKIAARFAHPNIAQVTDLGEINGSYFIAMELVHGEDLGRVMRKAWSTNQWVARPLSIRIVASACEGLYYAHTKTDDGGRPLKVVHRDISPQNILISFDGSVKLVDFGIAKAADQASLTRSGAIKGKFAYMSPEQAAGKPLDHRADIFAIGLVLYELLTGVRPLKRDTELATLQAALECKIAPPSKVADVPPELDEVVMPALAKSQEDRYRDARALQMALEEFLVAQRWVASSVQVSELMTTLFADRLKEEAKLGRPNPSEQEGPGTPSAPRPGHAKSEAATDGGKGGSPEPTGSVDATDGAGGNTEPGTGKASGPSPEPPSWDAPSGNMIPPRRRQSGEDRKAPASAPTSLARSPSRPEEPRKRTGSSSRVPRTPGRNGVRPSTSSQAVKQPRLAPPDVVHEEELEALESIAPLRHPRPLKLRPQVDPEPPPEGAQETLPISPSRWNTPQVRNAVLWGLAAFSAALLLFLFRDVLTQRPSDLESVLLTVEANLPVKVWIRHSPDEGAREEVVELGDAPLRKVRGAHVGDAVILENRQLGANWEEEIDYVPPNRVKIIQKEFQTGFLRVEVTPKGIHGLTLHMNDQKWEYPGPAIVLVEGRHTLLLKGAALREPVQFPVVVKGKQITHQKVDISKLLQR